MDLSTIGALLGGVAAVLSSVGAVLRYLVQMAGSLERTSARTATMSENFERHVSASETFHAALTDRVTDHGEQLAALRATVDGRAVR